MSGYQDNDHLIFRRSTIVIIGRLRYVIALCLCVIALHIGVTFTLIIPYWDEILNRSVFIIPVLAFFYIGVPILVGIKFWFALEDQLDEKYEVTPEGVLKATYKAPLKMFATQSGPVHRVDSGYFSRRGFLALLFNYGNVYLQVGWAQRRFVLLDVHKPARVLALIMHRAKSAPKKKEESALTGVMERIEE